MIQYLTLIIFLHERKKIQSVTLVFEPVWSEMGQTQKLNNRHKTKPLMS